MIGEAIMATVRPCCTLETRTRPNDNSEEMHAVMGNARNSKLAMKASGTTKERGRSKPLSKSLERHARLKA
jgi:hypothetical protein